MFLSTAIRTVRNDYERVEEVNVHASIGIRDPCQVALFHVLRCALPETDGFFRHFQVKILSYNRSAAEQNSIDIYLRYPLQASLI